MKNQKLNLRIFFILFSLLCAHNIQAQTNRLYTTQQGLATSDINSMTVDHNGLVWLSGNGQLGYFDGREFNYIPNTDPVTKQRIFQSAHQIHEEKEGYYWVMSNRGLLFFDSYKLTFKHIKLRESEDIQRGYSVKAMLDMPDRANVKLVITEGFGVYLFDTEKRCVLTDESQRLQELVRDGFVFSACIDYKGRIWLNPIRKDMVCIDSKTLKKIPIEMTDEARQMVAESFINEMIGVSARKGVYFACDKGMMKYDDTTQKLSVVHDSQHKTFQSLLYTQHKELLAGTDSHGLWQIDENDQLKPYDVTDQVFDLSLAKVRDMVQDRDGNIIIALLQKGVLVIPHRNDEFRYHPISLHNNGRNTSCITSIAIDSKKNYWIATDGAGMFTTNGMHMATAHAVNEGLRSLLMQTVIVDNDDEVWVGSYGGGIQHWVKDHFETPVWIDTLKHMPVMSMTFDKQRNLIIVGTNGSGVYVIDKEKKSVIKLKYGDNAGDWISSVYIDNENMLWVGEVGQVYYFNATTGINGSVRRDDIKATPTCFLALGKGKDKRVLIGTAEGMLVYHPQTDNLEHMLTEESIVSFNQTDKDVWVATTSKIFALNKETLKAERYTSFGGFYVGEFHQESTLNNHAGNILFGCDNGIICFSPAAIRQQHKTQNSLLFTNLQVNNRTVNYNDSTDILDSDIRFATCITLPYDDNSFGISFSVPYLSSPTQVHYEYLLDGYDNNWTACNNTHSARYNSLPSGKYTLHVRAYIEGDATNTFEKSLTIYVKSPWYNTTWAHIVYFLICMVLAYIVWRIYQNRLEQKRALQKALHNEEIKEAKLRLFTSITHELRTPLTMIMSPLRQLTTLFEQYDQHKDDEEGGRINAESVLNSLDVMRHNSNRLLNIVKQITDIRKIDAGQFHLHFKETDICLYIHQIAMSFVGVATVKRINFSIEDSEKTIYAWIDPVHFEKIIINILSNAFKFCPEGHRITVRNRIVKEHLEISIYNGGSHINEDDLAHIYERFYQTQEGQRQVGSGIGLNLAYELVGLHHGEIMAHNVEPDGVEFTITLPLGCAHLSAEELEEESIPEPTIPLTYNQDTVDANVSNITTETVTEEGATADEKNKKIPSILIVDDSKDILEYLKAELQNDYAITLAFSGNSAWNMVLLDRPDVILTDMKMPDGDGIELCQRIKANPELDHIPIIMLTGEGDESIQLESLRLNVDHYVQKPFNIIILRGLIKQVLRVRESMRQHIQRTDITTDYKQVVMDSAEDKLFARINKTLQDHIDDSEFGVQELANEVGISRVHLNRKMKEKYGLSPNVFIRSFRLKQAAYLLVHNKVNVSEVAYRVGFSTHSYFSSSFREYFGMSPKEFVTCHAEGMNDEALKKLLE